jgi:hypothetical protein
MVDGSDHRVLVAEAATAPLSLVLVIDTDMEDRLPVRVAVVAIAASLHRQHPDARLRLALLQKPAVSFLSPGDSAAIDRIMGRFVSGYSLLPGVAEAAKVLSHETTVRRVVFAITRASSVTSFTAEQAAAPFRSRRQVYGALKWSQR